MEANHLDWTKTRLWRLIRQSTEEHDPIRITLLNSMPKAELVLAKGGTALPDFTLHDASHAYRVAERIVDLLPDGLENCLQPVEASLLLLSAYLHDIGMTPNRERAQNHYQYILTADKSLLNQDEIEALQRWLDSDRSGLSLPVLEGQITVDGLAEADDIFSYYCRYRHNDWSEDWIRSELSDVVPGLYPNWIGDLISLCRSHHEGLIELRRSRFDARIAGNPGSVVNLRYLAALLRVADVLEFDPERTPAIILRHRGIAPKSRIFWYKDKEIAFQLEPDGSRLLLAARTPDAPIHRAILDTARCVDSELALCSTLQHEGAFQRGNISETDRRRYHWHWPARLTLDVREKDSSFVYINGAFRPEAGRILQLLSGTALYGTRMAAVRELLQNAIDAVREQIAYERLAQDEPSNPDFEETLKRIHRVTLSFEKDSDGYWLVCADDGVGMTKELIENHLLVSGSEPRAEGRRLERLAESRGFTVDRTGQFGIGVLSYFMISDRIVLISRRSAEAGGDPENTGWRFSIDGISAFGELKTESRGAKGTEVRLRLKDEVVWDNPAKWFEHVHRYVASTLRYAPCRVEIVNKVDVEPRKHFGPDWTASLDSFSPMALSGLKNFSRRPNLLTVEDQEKFEREDQRWLELYGLAEASIRWFGPEELFLPGNLGRARIMIPYFEIDGDPCLAFMDIEKGNLRAMPDRDVYFLRDTISAISWKGFRVHSELSGGIRAVIEVDLKSGAAIAVDRAKVVLNDSVKAAWEGPVHSYAKDVMHKFLKRFSSSRFSLLNQRLAFSAPDESRESESLSDLYWKEGAERNVQWSKFRFPTADLMCMDYDHSPETLSYRWSNKTVRVLSDLRISEFNYVSPVHVLTGGVLALYGRNWNRRPSLLWRTQKDFSLAGACHAWCVTFPPDWEVIACVRSRGRSIFNIAHPFFRAISKSEINFYQKFPVPADDEPVADQLRNAVKQKSTAIAWILARFGKTPSYWNAIRDNFPHLYEELFQAVELDQALIIWDLGGVYRDRVTSVSRKGACESRDASEEGLILPDANVLPWPRGNEWYLEDSKEHAVSAGTVKKASRRRR